MSIDIRIGVRERGRIEVERINDYTYRYKHTGDLGPALWVALDPARDREAQAKAIEALNEHLNRVGLINKGHLCDEKPRIHPEEKQVL